MRLLTTHIALCKQEYGAINFIVAAVGLPILLLLFAVAVDFIRLPILSSTLNRAIIVAYESSELAWDATNNPVGIEPFQPTGLNLCDYVSGSSTSCNTIVAGTTGLISGSSIATEYSRAYCNNIASTINSGSLLFSATPETYRFACAVYRFSVNNNNGNIVGYQRLGNEAVVGNYPLNIAPAPAGSCQVTHHPNDVAECINIKGTLLPPLPTQAGGTAMSIGFPVQKPFGVSANPEFIEQTYMIVTAKLVVKSIFGKFGLVGGPVGTRPDEGLVSTYSFFPWSSSVGFQSVS